MEQTVKQQAIERIKQANHILVTVSNDPNVDQLTACVGLTLMLNAMDKHATAVFSGKIPSTIEFLKPEETIVPTTDSLQDFIISLDKHKADKLRYKVEDDVVRIFITPYRSIINESDLVFSQGDINVEVVLALGVSNREQLDKVIAAHGRILHDATIISINAGESGKNDLGQLNWSEPTASSLCEMIVSISEAFGSGLIDNQMATAFLTGIVAQTDRFSNDRTNPKVMTMSAQLMASGANQQLIARKLEKHSVITMAPKDLNSVQPENVIAQEAPDESGQLEIPHDTPKTPPPANNPNEIFIDEGGKLMSQKEAVGMKEPERALEPLQVADLPRPEPKVEPEPLPVPDETSKSAPTDESHRLLDSQTEPGNSVPINGVGQTEPLFVDPMSLPINQPPKNIPSIDTIMPGPELPPPDPKSIADLSSQKEPMADVPVAPTLTKLEQKPPELEVKPQPEPAQILKHSFINPKEQEETAESPGDDIKSARSAVENAISAAPSPPPLGLAVEPGDVIKPSTPTEAATSDSSQSSSDSLGVPPSPPPVPPPLMPFQIPPQPPKEQN